MPIVRSKDAKRRRRRMAYINGSKPFHYYNEWDAKTAAWLRELIRRGHLPDGIVDERSITEVAPEDLRGFRQWHFFAGIGGWPLALKLAGWPADAPVCTGSPPCQPFSVAGKRGGRDDSRHLAPAFLDLIAELRPPAIFGEQVSAAIKELWLDALFVELEDEGYTCASAVLPACSVGAPHKRDRLFFGAIDLADLVSDGLERRLRGWADPEWQTIRRPAGRGGAAGDLANGDDDRQQSGTRGGGRSGPSGSLDDAGRRGSSCQLPDTADSAGLAGIEGAAIGELSGGYGEVYACFGLPDQDHGAWSNADWLLCRDGNFRPVESSAQQMVDGLPRGMGRIGDSDIRAIEESVSRWAEQHKTDGREGMRNLWHLLLSEEVEGRTDGGFDRLHEAPFLLSFMRQLAEQGWKFAFGDERSGAKAFEDHVRMLRYTPTARYSSYRRGLDEQRPGEPADALRQLSQIVACHTAICWGATRWKDAGTSFPLAENAPGRVLRLRGYGNAIVPQVAAQFIRNFMVGTVDFLENV